MLKRIPFLALTFWLVCLTLPAFADGDTSSAKWEVISNQDGFITQRKSVEGSNIFAFRGETIADVAIGNILSVFLDSSTRDTGMGRYTHAGMGKYTHANV